MCACYTTYLIGSYRVSIRSTTDWPETRSWLTKPAGTARGARRGWVAGPSTTPQICSVMSVQGLCFFANKRFEKLEHCQLAAKKENK